MCVKSTWIGVTWILWWTAAHRGIAIVAWWALADATMIHHIAKGKGTTLTRRSTFAVDACLAGITLGVRSTAQGLLTLYISIAQESRQATAIDAVIDGHTLGILATRILLARIDATTIETIAELVRRTILIVLADMGACYMRYVVGYGAQFVVVVVVRG